MKSNKSKVRPFYFWLSETTREGQEETLSLDLNQNKRLKGTPTSLFITPSSSPEKICRSSFYIIPFLQSRKMKHIFGVKQIQSLFINFFVSLFFDRRVLEEVKNRFCQTHFSWTRTHFKLGHLFCPWSKSIRRWRRGVGNWMNPFDIIPVATFHQMHWMQCSGPWCTLTESCPLLCVNCAILSSI